MTGTPATKVAFCGLGRMGRPMAGRIAAAGFPLTVWNRSRPAVDAIVADSDVDAADTPAQASQGADVVLIMLTDGPAVLDTLGGADGVLAGVSADAVVIDCSTTGAEHARTAARLCRDHGVAFLDCPVSGSTAVAARGQLGLMVGGDGAVLERVRPVLEAIGHKIVHVGPTGAGAAAKVAVNGLLHTFSTALAESLVAAEAAGVSRTGLFDVLAAGVLSNRFLDYKRDAFVDPDHAQVAFDLRTATKDLALALTAAQQARLPVSVIQRTLTLHRQALDDGYGDRDMAAMAAWFGSQAGTGEPVTEEPIGQHPERN